MGRTLLITESLAAVVPDPGTQFSAMIASLSSDDLGRSSYGHARVLHVLPADRRDGVAVVLGEEALSTVPDPLRILVTEGRGRPGVEDGVLTVRRAHLPVSVDLDTLRVTRLRVAT